MDELYQISHQYYTKLESFRESGLFKMPSFYLVMISAFFFGLILSLFLYKLLVQGDKSSFLQWLGYLISSEVIMLFLLNSFQNNKEKKTIQRLNDEMRASHKNLNEIKIALLQKSFSCEQTSFLKLAEEISSMLKISNIRSTIKDIFSFIFNEKAKPRLITLFVLFSSLITVLSISAGSNIVTVFEAYSGNTTLEIVFVYLSSVLFFIVVGYGINKFFSFSQLILISINLRFANRHSRNIHALEYLINDLNNYHTLKKVVRSPSYIKSKFTR